MKKTFKYILAGTLALLGFSSCSALREAREAREAREREALEKQQRELVEQTLQEMLERDAQDPEFQNQRSSKWNIDSTGTVVEERIKLLYAVPNVPYREIKEN